jgi:tetratricopeptide (TPR) repeat protein
MSRAIETAIKKEDWKRARRLVRAALRQQPDSHWLIARLALTYYEEHNYEHSLTIAEQARKTAPHCPLVLWELAGSLDMLGRHRTAIAIYRRLIRRGVESITFGDCGEGLAWARGLIADCWYRVARCQHKVGRRADAVRGYERHLAMRGPGCRSIYALHDVRKELFANRG